MKANLLSPLFQITWLDGNGHEVKDGIEQATEAVGDTKRLNTVSTLKLDVKKSHHNTSLTCQAQNGADRTPKSASIHLLVEYAPHITIKSDHSPIFAGGAVTFSCEAHANPSTMSYR